MDNYNSINEVWKDIDGYEGLYQVSNLGRIKSVKRVVSYKNAESHRNGGSHNVKENIKKSTIKLNKNKTSGYNVVSLYKNNKASMNYVHRLVASAFIENPFNKETVNHIDGDKQNNRMSNLEWATYLENNSHAIETGLTDFSNRKNEQSKSKQVSQYDLDWNFIKTYPSMREAQRQTGCDGTQIGRCCKDSNKTSKGFRWSYNK